MAKIYVGDTGTVFDILADPYSTGLNLTGYTVSVVFQKPNGTTIERTAALKPSSTNTVRYTIAVGDFDIAGTWRAQLRITLGSTTWLGETFTFQVYATFA